ncbi:MAG: sphingomyelin phosphodiesterase [Ginsengibacter sp.]
MLPLLICAYQKARINFIAPKMEPFDVVVFSEAFDNRMRTILIKSMAKVYSYYTRILRDPKNANNKISICQNGGVIIFSKYEILEQDQTYYYKTPCQAILKYLNPSHFIACKGSDCLAQKGVVYAKILKNELPYHIFASHLQASYKTKEKYQKVREKQLNILNDFIESKFLPVNEPVIIAGDLNVDRLSSKEEYDCMLKTLNATIPDIQIGPNYTVNPENNCLADKGAPEYIDYVLFRKNHNIPYHSTIETKLFKCDKPYLKKGKLCDALSDHYPVVCNCSFN